MIVAIIPARGGSKRIKNKNIKSFFGQPLITYAIQAAKKAQLFDKIIVTTDSEEIAEVAKNEGADVPFMRPANLSDDYTPTIPVLKHAIKWLLEQNISIEYFCCIYANPFVTAENIIKGFNLLKEKDATSVVPVTTFSFPIFRGVMINENGQLEFVFPEKSVTRHQDLPEVYQDTGQFYWWNCKTFMEINEVEKLQKTNRYPLIIQRYIAQDLDKPEDWEIAEKLYRLFRNE